MNARNTAFIKTSPRSMESSVWSAKVSSAANGKVSPARDFACNPRPSPKMTHFHEVMTWFFDGIGNSSFVNSANTIGRKLHPHIQAGIGAFNFFHN
ncbi:hypothetical protein [Spirosoma montaniterrae]|nr:hypothetical protein [Spirosoma montaniterrae]